MWIQKAAFFSYSSPPLNPIPKIPGARSASRCVPRAGCLKTWNNRYAVLFHSARVPASL